MKYKFIVRLKGVDFKYQTEANNITEAKIKIRNHIKNAVELIEDKPENDFINFFNDIINEKK